MSDQQPRHQKIPDPPMVPFVLGGMAVFALVGLILLIADGPQEWVWICFAGFVWGFPGWAMMVIHDRNRKKRLSS